MILLRIPSYQESSLCLGKGDDVLYLLLGGGWWSDCLALSFVDYKTSVDIMMGSIVSCFEHGLFFFNDF